MNKNIKTALIFGFIIIIILLFIFLYFILYSKSNDDITQQLTEDNSEQNKRILMPNKFVTHNNSMNQESENENIFPLNHPNRSKTETTITESKLKGIVHHTLTHSKQILKQVDTYRKKTKPDKDVKINSKVNTDLEPNTSTDKSLLKPLVKTKSKHLKESHLKKIVHPTLPEMPSKNTTNMDDMTDENDINSKTADTMKTKAMLKAIKQRKKRYPIYRTVATARLHSLTTK